MMKKYKAKVDCYGFGSPTTYHYKDQEYTFEDDVEVPENVFECLEPEEIVTGKKSKNKKAEE